MSSMSKTYRYFELEFICLEINKEINKKCYRNVITENEMNVLSFH